MSKHWSFGLHCSAPSDFKNHFWTAKNRILPPSVPLARGLVSMSQPFVIGKMVFCHLVPIIIMLTDDYYIRWAQWTIGIPTQWRICTSGCRFISAILDVIYYVSRACRDATKCACDVVWIRNGGFAAGSSGVVCVDNNSSRAAIECHPVINITIMTLLWCVYCESGRRVCVIKMSKQSGECALFVPCIKNT